MAQGDDGWGWLGVLILIGGAWYFLADHRSTPPAIITSPASANVTSAPPAEVPIPTPIKPVAPPPAPKPYYDVVEKGVYGYIAGISEEDAKRGKAAGDVMQFRYRGVIDGKYRLESVDAFGRSTGFAECLKPCVAIKSWWGGTLRVIAFNRGSVIGAAFDDALNGRLRVWKPPPPEPLAAPPQLAVTGCVETHSASELRAGACDDPAATNTGETAD